MGFLNSIFFIIVLVLTINQFALHLSSVAATDVLSQADELNSLESNSTLVSANGNFTLGFFTFDVTNTYLGIWYNDNDETKVWVANRDIPMTSSGSLVIDDSGTLKVIRRGGKFTNTTMFNVSNDVGLGNTRAVLKDSGNLVVYDVKSNRTLWQSFDHLTDTLLPGMKLGYNLTTGQNWTLTSWLTDEIPALGAFTLRLERIQNSPQLVIYRRGNVYWSLDLEASGVAIWKQLEIIVSDASGMYIPVDSLNQTDIKMTMLQLSSYGELGGGDRGDLPITWCYSNKYMEFDGCAVPALPKCRGQSDRFQLESGEWSGDFIQDDDSSNISVSDCMERCWNDCNCKGFSTSDDETKTRCTTWGGDAQFLLDDQNDQKKMRFLISPKPLKNVLNEGDEVDTYYTDSALVSAAGNFTMGFFTLQNFTYLGIWYTDDKERKVWVANRDIPMTVDGSLIIDSATLKVVWADNTTMFNVSNHSVDSGNTRAVLEDSGNFVLYDDANKKQILWQSFDHPTDILLPGMKLGYNLATGQNWTLTSWLRDDKAPASGTFTLTLERIQNSPQLVIYRHGKVYWSSGLWVDKRLGFEFLHSSISTFGTGILVSDALGMYFSIQNISGKSMLQLSSMGTLIDGVNNILTPTFCYGYESHDGCAISSLPNCRGQRDSFQFENGIWDGNLIHNETSSNISLSDCMQKCWNDCNCKGFSTNEMNETGCFTWGKNAVFHPNASESTQKGVLISLKPPKKKTWIWILVSVAILLISALTTYLCYKHRLKENQKKKRDDYIHQLTGSTSFNYGDELEKNIKDAPDVKIFSLKAILTATNNFSNENKLGQGGYGPVYKGKLFDGRQIAVKRLSKTSGQGIEEFKNELILISKVQHTNLVRLYGCCIHQEEKMLIYEFMYMRAEDQMKTINWQIRFNIIEGVAQGLLYLHKYSRMKVIHRDLKVSNVLLDNNMNPKIADFGMARIFQQNVTESITNRVVGTYGYMAPEYAMRGTFSIKSDVFSFGVLILEIVSGKKNSSFYSLNRALNLLGYAWELWKGHASLELKDESLGESYDLKQLLRTIHVGLLCVQENADDRPTMPTVISMLNNEIADLPNPKQPAFLTSTPLVEAADQNIPGSVNGLTVTMMEAR